MCAETEPTKPRAALDPSGEDKTTSFPESDTISLAFSPKSLLEVEEEEEDDQEDEHDVVLSTEPAQAENASMASSGLNYFQPDEHKQEWENLGIPMNCAPTGGFPICHSQLLEEQIEFMTRCRHPMDLLSMFNEDSNREGVEAHVPYTMYTLPKSCEYCGGEHTDQCQGACQRPKSFFLKQRPPFCPPGADWDSKTEELVAKPSAIENDGEKTDERGSSFLALSGFFGNRIRGQEQ